MNRLQNVDLLIIHLRPIERNHDPDAALLREKKDLLVSNFRKDDVANIFILDCLSFLRDVQFSIYHLFAIYRNLVIVDLQDNVFSFEA